MSEETPPKLDSDQRTAMHRLEDVEGLSPGDVDALSFGVIRVDRNGVVLAYNAAEAKLAERSPAEVLGKNFFTEVAPCTNVREFAGRSREGPVHVMVTRHYEEPGDHAWIFVDAFGGKLTPSRAREQPLRPWGPPRGPRGISRGTVPSLACSTVT